MQAILRAIARKSLGWALFGGFGLVFASWCFGGEMLTAVGEVVEIRVDEGRRVLVVEARLTDRRSDVVVEAAAEFDGGLF